MQSTKGSSPGRRGCGWRSTNTCNGGAPQPPHMRTGSIVMANLRRASRTSTAPLRKPARTPARSPPRTSRTSVPPRARHGPGERSGRRRSRRRKTFPPGCNPLMTADGPGSTRRGTPEPKASPQRDPPERTPAARHTCRSSETARGPASRPKTSRRHLRVQARDEICDGPVRLHREKVVEDVLPGTDDTKPFAGRECDTKLDVSSAPSGPRHVATWLLSEGDQAIRAAQIDQVLDRWDT